MKINNLKIVAYTSLFRIEGEIICNGESRLTDLLNSKTFDKEFLPIENAVLKNLKTEEIAKISFLSLNKKSIEVIYEEDN